MTMPPQNELPEATDDGNVSLFDRSYMEQPLPAPILKRLFDRIDISIETGQLQAACATVQGELESAQPGRRINLIFRALQMQGVQVSQLHWVRFDRRRLPALIFFDSQWQVVDAGEDEQVSLTDENGETAFYDAAALGDAIVVWLKKMPPRRSGGPLFTLTDNPAAQLVLSEVFSSRRWVRDVAIATLIVNVLSIATSLFALQVYDRVVPTLAYATLTTLVGGMAIIIGLEWVLKTIRARILDSVSSQVDRNVSQKVFDHVMHLQLDIRPRSLGTLAAQVGGLDLVRQFFTSGVIFALVDMPFALMFIMVIGLIGGWVAMVYLSLLPVAAVMAFISHRRMRRLMLSQMMRSNERQGLLVDVIQGTESIRANNATWRFSEQWKEITGAISGFSVRQKAISNFTSVTTASIANIGYVGGVVVGVYEIGAGQLTMGGLIACTILGRRIIAPVAQTVQYLSQSQNVAQALHMVSQVLLLNTERAPDQTLLMPDEAPSSVDVEALTFSYPESPVKHINVARFHVEAGERVALLGPLGAGKSTFLKVLAGLYRPSEGRIRLGNADLWEIDPNVVADHVAYLPQDVHLFKGTLRTNITLSGAISDSRLLNICKDLGVDRIAMDNPRGLDLVISEGGEGLSGGQRQLVGLARVFVARPRVWLLDEPTASLDNQSEQQVLKAITEHLRPEDILIVATHRPRVAMQLATRVVVMQRGEIKVDGAAEKVIPEIVGRPNVPQAYRAGRMADVD